MRGLLFLTVLILVSGCARNSGSNENTGQVPADSLISRDIMVKITADIHVLEAGILNRHTDRKDTKTLADHYYKELFSKYRISELRYRQNIDRLQRNSKDFMAFYDEVIAELDARIKVAQIRLKQSTKKK